VAIVDFGIMKSSYAISKGAQDLTLALSNSLGIDFKRAEEMKREIGLSDLPEHKEMVSVLEPLLEFIFSEINSVIKDYQRKNGQTVSRTIVVGGGALLKGLVGFAVKRLAMEVNLADPFSKTEYPAFLEKVLKEAGPNFSIALGLALRKLQ
jgi:Tfp pilus assembly PilM family ATPase